MRLTWKLTLSLAFCFILFASAVLWKFASLQSSGDENLRPLSNPVLALTAKLVTERGRAFRTMLNQFVALRNSSSTHTSELMGLFEAVAYIQPLNEKSTVRWVEKKLGTTQLALPESFLARFLVEYPWKEINSKQNFSWKGFTDAQGQKGILFIAPMNGDLLVGFLSSSFLSAVLADATDLGHPVWLGDGNSVFTLVEKDITQLSKWESFLGQQSRAEQMLLDGKERFVSRQKIDGTNLWLSEVHQAVRADTAASFSMTSLIIFLLGLSAVLVMVCFYALEKVFAQQSHAQEAEPQPVATAVPPTPVQLVLWPLLQSIKGPLFAALGHLQILRMEKSGDPAQLNFMEGELRRMQQVIYQRAATWKLQSGERTDENLQAIVKEFFSQKGTEIDIPHVPTLSLDKSSLMILLSQLDALQPLSREDVELIVDEGFVSLKLLRQFDLSDEWVEGAKQCVRGNGGEWAWSPQSGVLEIRFQLARVQAEEAQPEVVLFDESEKSVDVEKEKKKVDFQFRVRRPRLKEVEL